MSNNVDCVSRKFEKIKPKMKPQAEDNDFPELRKWRQNLRLAVILRQNTLRLKSHECDLQFQMAHKGDNYCLIKIPRFEIVKVYFFSIFIAVWFLVQRVFKMLWNGEKKPSEIRYKPLSCLVDNTLGFHSYVKLQGTKLHYVEVGNSDSPLALLLHGFPDCWLGWRHQMKSLSNHFRVVAIDLKGFGDSDKPIWRANYKIQTLIHEIHELIVSLQANKCVLIGHDIGAHIAWYFVTQYPEVVQKFVAISCPHPNVFWDYTSSTRFDSKWIQFYQVPFLPEMEAGGNDLSIIDEFYSHLSLQKEENLIEAYKYAFSRPEDWTGPINYYRNLPFYRIRDGKEILVPTLLIIGNRDPFIPLEGIVKSTEYISKYVLKIVKNGAHFPHQEYPDYVNNLLLQFLTVPKEKTESTNSTKGLMGSLYTNTMKYGNSFVDGVKKTTNGVVRLPSQMLKHSS